MSAAPDSAHGTEAPGTRTTGMTLLSVIKPAPDLKMVIDQFDRWTNPTDARCDCSWVCYSCIDLSTARSVA